MSNELCSRCGEHCYAKLLNGTGTKVYDEDQFCLTCKAHLAASGICLNACHLSRESLNRFSNMLNEIKKNTSTS